MTYYGVDIKEVYPFELKGKTIEDIYFTAANALVIVFTDGKKVRIVGFGSELEIKKFI